MNTREKLEDAFESVLFASRWLMAPFYLGLVVALLALMAEFIKTILEVLPGIVELSEASAVVWVLTLIDLSLAANLLLVGTTAAQMLHVGPYSAEGPTIARLHAFLHEQGLAFDGHVQRHHEIYLGDPRRAAPDKLRTIIRQPYVV